MSTFLSSGAGFLDANAETSVTAPAQVDWTPDIDESDSAAANLIENEPETSDNVTLDYNSRPTLIPRPSTLFAAIAAYVFIYFFLAYIWVDVQALQSAMVVISLLIAWVINWVMNCLLPNRIKVTEKGITLGWNNVAFHNISAPVIPWSTIHKVEYEKCSAFEESIEGTVVLKIAKMPKAGALEYSYKFLSSKIWKLEDNYYKLRILISGITNKADREFLARTLHQKLPKGLVQTEAIRSLDPRYPRPIEQKNAMDISCSYVNEEQRNKISRNTSDDENLANVAELNEFLPNMARLLPRSIMEEKLRDSLGLAPGEILDGNAQETPVFDPKGKTTLTYKPLRMLRPMLEAVERSGSLMFTCMVLPLFVIGLIIQSFNVTWMIPFIICVFIGVPVILLGINWLNPRSVELAEEGLRLHWRQGDLKLSSPLISWGNVSLVSYSKPANSWAINTTINIHVMPENMPLTQHIFYYSFFQSCFSTCNHIRISLIESGLLYGQQKQLFHEALRRYLPPEKIDPLLIDSLCPQKESSFTSLWLSILTKERVRIEPLDAGDKIGDGRYQVVKQIGAGGQGIAYEAISIEGGSETEERVVLKEFIIPSHAGQSAQAKALESVHRECELLQSITHPYVVKMKDSFIEDHRFYLVLEHAQGESLRKLVNENGPLSDMETMELAVQLLGILSHLHTMSPPVIHRDFTPENIIIAEDGTPKLIDFNVARQAESTATRTVVGKHSYLPPEQFRGKACTQSDIYALGASLYFALTGEDPEPISASRPSEKSLSVSKRLDEIIYRATQLSTDDRYKTADDMKDDLLSQATAA